MSADKLLAISGITCTAGTHEYGVDFSSGNITEPGPDILRSEVKASEGLTFSTEISFDPGSSVWRRRDVVKNQGNDAVSFSQPKMVFCVGGDKAEIVVQKSGWCNEAQEQTVILNNGTHTVFSKGRSCTNHCPYFRVVTETEAFIVNLLASGDWRTSFRKSDDGVEIAVDLCADDIVITLQPGEIYTLAVECLVQFTPPDSPEKYCHQLHGYVLDHLLKVKNNSIPVVYNTWFDRFDKISWDGMGKQIETAAKVGCEAFVIDAGWFGAEAESWSSLVGDWHENPAVFSPGRSLFDFSNLVRSRGLKFGIWMEPERLCSKAPVVREHPDWFIQTANPDCLYPDLAKIEAANWILSEMSRVIETYNIEWLKIDCNLDFSDDPYHTGNRLRLEAWYSILGELRARFPDIIIEGCASGGMRADLLTCSHFHTHFLSDTVDPVDVIRIGMAKLSALPPVMQEKWPAIYPTGNRFTMYDHEPYDTGDQVLTATTASCSKVTSFSLDFALLAAMPGVFGVTGNIADLDDRLKQQLADYITFYKRNREFIQSAVGVPLTPIEPITSRYGLADIQLSSRDFRKNMIFVYNLSVGSNTVRIDPFGLQSDGIYTIYDEKAAAFGTPQKGSSLLSDGLEIECPPGHARAITIEC